MQMYTAKFRGTDKELMEDTSLHLMKDTSIHDEICLQTNMFGLKISFLVKVTERSWEVIWDVNLTQYSYIATHSVHNIVTIW